MQTYGRIDCLVLNAAVNPAVAPLVNTSEEQIDKIFDINVKSTILLTQVRCGMEPAGDDASTLKGHAQIAIVCKCNTIIADSLSAMIVVHL